MNWIGKLFGGGSVVKSIENIATEWIETDKEKAEAKTVMIKALDPNGMMRRQLSKDVTQMYKVYLAVTLLLLIAEFVAGLSGVDAETLKLISSTTAKTTDLFLPISGLFGLIVSASFGVNYANVKKGN